MVSLGLWRRFAGPLDIENNHMISNGVTLLWVMGVYNVLLLLLNLLPIPPLDGSRIVANLAPPYRRLIGNPTMSGVFMAVLFGALYCVGDFLAPVAINFTSRVILLVSGQGHSLVA